MVPQLHIAGLSVSETRGAPHRPVDSLAVTLDGIQGDRHSGPGLRQVSILHEAITRHYFPETPADRMPGLGQENILVRGEGLADLRVLDTFEMGDAILEITKIGRSVNATGLALCSASNKCLLSDHGIFARVVHRGTIDTGLPVRHQQRLLRAHVITISDRASRGEAEDTSGPAINGLLEAWCADHHWSLWVETQIIPDEREAIVTMLENARRSEADVVITTGGTGVGPRDITPDVVTEFANKLIPGIMDFIRLKYGDSMPMALTSRSVAAVLGTGLIYTLPGSTKAIPEYLGEIFKTMEHMLLLLKGLDAHG